MSIFALENTLDPKLVGYAKPNPKPPIEFGEIDFESKEPIKAEPIQIMAKPKDEIDFESPDFESPGEVGYKEPSISTYRPQERGKFGKVWDEILQYSKDTAGENAKSQNAYNMAESLGIGYSEAYNNLDILSKNILPKDQPSFRELVEGTMMAGVTAGLLAHPVATIIGVGTFMALDEVENAAISKMTDRKYKFGAALGPTDVLPSDTRQEIKDLVWLADMSWKAIAAGGMAKKFTPGVQQGIQNLYTRFVRDVSESQGFPKSIYISPETFAAFRGKGNEKINTQIEGEVLKHVNLTRDQIKLARDQGIDIEIPADKIITMVDKPWWGAVKKMFGAEAFKSTKIVPGDATRITPHMLQLPPPLDSIPKPPTAAKLRPVGVPPEYTFTSKKGSVYEKIGEYWYNEKGEVVTNRFAIQRAEEVKTAPEKVVIPEEVRPTETDELDSDLRGLLEADDIAPVDPKEARLKKIKEGVERAKEKKAKVAEPAVDEVEFEPPLPERGGHPFRNSSLESSKRLRSTYLERVNSITSDPDLMVGKLINDVNLWLNGEKVPIEQVRMGLEEMSRRADELVNEFDTPQDFESFRATVGEAAKWARNSDRLTNKRTGGTQLNMMIPLNDAPEIVKDILATLKAAKDSLYRNKEIFDKTGYWAGKDGKWRYEIGDEGLKVRPDLLKTEYYITPIEKVVDHPTLYSAVPELKGISIQLDLNLKSAGVYHPNTKTIEIKRPNKDTIVHEVQHAVNEIMGSRFRGSNPQVEGIKLTNELLIDLDRAIQDPEVRDLYNRFLDQYKKGDPEKVDSYAIRLKEKSKDPREVTEIDKALQNYLSQSAEEAYMKDPGEMESRLTSRRREMSAENRKKIPPWETLEYLLSGEMIPEEAGFKLYSGIDPTEATKSFSNTIKRISAKLKRRPKTEAPSIPPPNPFRIKETVRDIVYTRRAGLDTANYETNKFINSIEQRTTSIQRETLPFVIEKTDVPKEFNRPDLQEAIDNNKELLTDIGKEVKIHFDESWKKIKFHLPDMTTKQIEDYVTHLWDIPRHKKAEATAWFSTQNRLLERRFIPTYAEGIRKGYKPKTLDIGEIISVHDAITNKAIENTKYVDAILALKDEGISLVTRSDEAPLDWVEVDYPAFTRKLYKPKKAAGFIKEIKVRVHPELVRPLKAIFEERFDHPVIGAYEAINGVLKKSMLSLSLFHHGALGETGIAIMGLPKTAGIYFNPVKIYKALAKGEYDVFAKEELAKDSINHGVQYGATADIPVARIQKYLNTLAMSTKDIPIVNRLTDVLKDSNSVWDKALWSYLHDTLKLYAYESLVGKLDAKSSPELVTRSKREIGQFINDTFGGQNWDNLMITPKEVQMLTWSLLSADWTYSTTRQALAPTGIGKVYKETEGLRKKMGRHFWFRAALYFGLGMNVLNAAFRKWDEKDNPQYYPEPLESLEYTMWGNSPGKKTYLFRGRYEDGSERYVRWGKQFRDFFELIASPFNKLGGKMAPLAQLMSEMFTGHSLSGFKNDDLYGADGLDKTIAIAKTLAKAPLPLSIKKALQENIEFQPLDVIMQSSKGMSRYSSIEYFKQAILNGDEEFMREVYVATLRNNLPAFTLFGYALGWIEAEAVAKLKDTVDDLDDVKEQLHGAKAPFDRKRLGKLLSRMHEEKADIEAGLSLFDAAASRAKIYMNLESQSSGNASSQLRSRGSGGRVDEEIRFE